MKNPIILFLCTLCAITTNAQVGIGTTSPNTTLDIRGSMAINKRSFSTTSESVGITDYSLLFTGTSACTLTLPDATTFPGRLIHIKNTKTGTVPVLTIATTSSQTIDGSSTWLLDDPNEAVNVVSDGSNWHIMGQSLPSGSGTDWTQGGNTVTTEKKLGTIDNYALPFITNNTEKMRLSTSGFLGIGTTSPGARIHAVSEGSESGDDYIFDDYTNTTTQGIFLRRARGTVASPSNLQNGDPISYLRFVGRYNNTLGYTNGSGIDAYYMGNGSLDSTDLRFFTSGGERMRIDHAGNVGIGSSNFDGTAPEKLLIDAGSTSSYNLIGAYGERDGYLQFNIMNSSNATLASTDIVATADNGTESTYYIDMGINSSGYSNGNNTLLNGPNRAYLYAVGKEFYIGNGKPGEPLVFFTNPTGGTTLPSSANGTARMTITGAGNVGVGTTTPNSTLSVGGSIAVKYVTNNNDYTLLATDYVVINTGNPAATWTLPDPTGCAGRVYKLVNHGNNAVTLSRSVTTANGSTTTNLGAAAGTNTMEIISDGSVWRKIN